MENWLLSSIHTLLAILALPAVGLPAIFIISLVSATLLPMGSEPAVFGYVQMAPHMFWPAVMVATAGNTIGGVITYAMGAGAETAWHAWHERQADDGSQAYKPDRQAQETGTGKNRPGGRWQEMISGWFRRFGPPALLLSWLPVIGDPLCAVAGWLRLPFWKCVAYMAAGKFARYVTMTAILMHAWPWISQWL